MASPASRSRKALLLVACLTLCTAIYVASGRAAGSKRRDPKIAIRFHSEVSTFDPSFAAEVTAGNPPRKLIVEKIPSISERDIDSFYPYTASDGTFSAVFHLDRHGQAVLETVSTQNRGRHIVAAVNARPVALLAVDKTISDGILYIPSGLTLDEVHELGASFSLMGQSENDKDARNAPRGSTFSEPGAPPPRRR